MAREHFCSLATTKDDMQIILLFLACIVVAVIESVALGRTLQYAWDSLMAIYLPFTLPLGWKFFTGAAFICSLLTFKYSNDRDEETFQNLFARIFTKLALFGCVALVIWIIK